ncbi:putative isochorismatase family protein [Thermoplasmatales archaeon]|nr:putative isochorismatase family protein [Thermoplasmatales archaeon]
MNEEKLNIKSTALVIIDLQIGISRMDTKPYPSATVIGNASLVAKRFRELGMPVFPVHVASDQATALHPISDSTFTMPADPDHDWTEFVPEIDVQERDIVITKRQWGAFYGTELDLQLRRRKIETIVLCGVATTYGVESTARYAYELGYNQVFIEDAMGDLSEESHRVVIQYVFKRMGRVRSTREVIAMIQPI